MLVDSQKIIKETKDAFFSNDTQKEKYASIQDFVSETDYKELHTAPLVPLDISIDVELFLSQVVEYQRYFEHWGKQHQDLPRQGLALVNQYGHLEDNDPINGSLYEWNVNNPNNPLLETDCKRPTQVMWMSSMDPLRIFQGHWCRSNILLWDNGAEFKPHIDTLVPSPWIRLWGTTSNSIRLRFEKDGELVEHPDVEPGRIYIIDTSIVHDAYCKGEPGLQFFLSVLPSAYDLVKNKILHSAI